MDLVDQLSEELTCQQVMLKSLEDESHGGVEAERDEIRADIARLRRLLDKAKRGQDAIEDANEDEEENPDEDNAYTQSQTLRPEPRRATPVRSPQGDPWDASSGGPSHSGRASVATPPGREIWDNAEPISLPSRKRERTLTASQGPQGLNKSRRTTPTPMSHPFDSPGRQNGYGDFDFIDLTGDDEIDQATITRQTREANQRKQEAADRALALELSSQDSFSHTPDIPTGQNNAFERIMNTQQLNSGPSQYHSDQPVSAAPEVQTDGDFGLSGPSQMPGTYYSSWDASDQPGPSSYRGGTIPSTHGPNQPVIFGTPSVPGESAGNLTLPSIGDMGLGSANFASLTNPASSNFRNREAPEGLGGVQGFSNPATGRDDPLSSIISRTGQFDFVNGIDGSGNPLSERLTHYIQDVMHDTRVSDKELDDLLQNIRPDMDIPETNRDGTPEGLKGTLYRHQELALSWSKKMEEGSNRGGILADDMGLGKTISMISLMLTRKATSRPKTNLIVAPLALLRQWDEEIKTKVRPSHRLSTLIYHGKKSTTEELLKYDVVLTTYGTLAAEVKRLDNLFAEDRERRVDFNDKTVAAKCPLLHPNKAVFHRIILDEAQCIKNKETKTAKAAYLLRSTYRWCLTGTPMMNGVFELYSLIHFLKIKPYCQWDRFTSTFGSLFGKRGVPRGAAMKRLRALLKATMLRRKKDSELDGKPIIRLPPKSEEEVHVELSADERDFYDQLESRSRILFNKYLREGTVGKNYSNILVLLLRLRQTCCHPHLNLDVDDAAQATSMSEEQMVELVQGLDSSIVDRIKEIDAFECPICYDVVPSPSFFVPCGHDSCQECLSHIIDTAQASGIRQGREGGGQGDGAISRCPVCRGSFDPNKCFTYEVFCKVHMPETLKKEEKTEEKETETASDDDSETDSDTDSESDIGSEDEDADDKGNLRNFVVDDEFLSSEDEDSKQAVKLEESNAGQSSKMMTKKKERAKKSKKKDKGKDKVGDVRPAMLRALRKEAPKNRSAFKKYMAYLRKTWLPSAKVAECMKLLASIESTSGEKTIIFSQWTLLLDLVEVAMHHEGFQRKPERYDGSMSGIRRNNAASAFRNNPDVKVILVSLRAGNAGLNLTAASRVIILDPFWNPYIEMQAVDRAYRIGQQREVKVYRILTTETVEDRIVALQNKKKEIVEAALDESESRKIGRLTTTELKYLFNGGD